MGRIFFDCAKRCVPAWHVGNRIVIIFNFINYWNDLLTPMLLLSSTEKKTVMVALTSLVQKTQSQPTCQMAGLVISVLPAICIYLFLQKYLVKGLTMGSFR